MNKEDKNKKARKRRLLKSMKQIENKLPDFPQLDSDFYISKSWSKAGSKNEPAR